MCSLLEYRSLEQQHLEVCEIFIEIKEIILLLKIMMMVKRQITIKQ